MKLTELSPQWIERDGVRLGVLFLCPCCLGKTPRVHVSCFKVGQGSIHGQYNLLSGMVPDNELDQIIPCKKGFAWGFSGDFFESLSITPSIDASDAGHWHGFITNGEVT